MHLAHLRSLPCVQVQETPELYMAVVLPHIESIPASRLQWVYNILEMKVQRIMLQAERLLYASSLLSRNAELAPEGTCAMTQPLWHEIWELPMCLARRRKAKVHAQTCATPIQACQHWQQGTAVLLHAG